MVLLILTATLVGILWHAGHYYIIDFQLYPKDARELDLRGREISTAHYEKIRSRLPDCEIHWDIPFQGSLYPEDTEALTVTELSEEDIEELAWFPALETVNAENCEDYALLRQLQEAYPEVEVRYSITVSGVDYPQNAESVSVDGITEEEIAALAYLPNLKTVCMESGKDPARLEALSLWCEEKQISFQVMIGGEGYGTDITELEAREITAGELELLRLLPELKKLHLVNPKAKAETLFALEVDRTELELTWEKEILGASYSGDAVEIDLTAAISEEGAYAYEQARRAPVQGDRDEVTYLFATDDDYPLPDMTEETAELIARVEEAAAYFPNLERLIMCGSILDNEAMASFREAHREDYKVVWTVQCGGMVARTDTPYFMPTKYHVYYFQDHESGNLKYCEDMVSMDVGHMSIKHVEWAAYMPNLEYLVLAHTDVRSIEPLRNCRKLKFLELDWSASKDLSPLLDCTALEDLNLGNTSGDFSPIEEMTWLKNLWMVGCSSGAVYRISQALTETKIVSTGSATVAGGWRDLPNYYAMRDALGMYYMSW